MTSEATHSNSATTAGHWGKYYESADQGADYHPADTGDFRNLPLKVILDSIKAHYRGGSVLEIGAGNSDLLIEICRRFNPPECCGLDYLEQACEMLSSKAGQAGADIKVVCADMFDPPRDLKRKFDFVLTSGVVEHFRNLPETLGAIAGLAKENGVIYTLVPNIKGTIYGFLMRRWNIDVYNAHVPYDSKDLECACQRAGLDVVWTGYLCSSHFGVLAWCFNDRQSGFSYWFYKQLTRLSKLIWLLESKFGLLKPGRLFAPYIVCVSRPSSK